MRPSPPPGTAGVLTPLWSQVPGGGDEEARRRRLLQMQEEISQGLLDVSDEEREKFLAKKAQVRNEIRKQMTMLASRSTPSLVKLTDVGRPPMQMSKKKGKMASVVTRTGIKRGKSYAERKNQLLVDNVWITGTGLALMWAFGSFESSVSYALGALCGFGYLVMLGAYVESIGKSEAGKGVSFARFALVIVLVVLAGKFREVIQVIPALLGFSMYQVASLIQAFDREDEKETTSNSFIRR